MYVTCELYVYGLLQKLIKLLCEWAKKRGWLRVDECKVRVSMGNLWVRLSFAWVRILFAVLTLIFYCLGVGFVRLLQIKRVLGVCACEVTKGVRCTYMRI